MVFSKFKYEMKNQTSKLFNPLYKTIEKCMKNREFAAECSMFEDNSIIENTKNVSSSF